MTKPKLKTVDNVAKMDTRNEYEKNIQTMWDMLPYVIQEWEPKSKFLKAKYDGLIREGFTEQQAMEIIKTRPIFE